MTVVKDAGGDYSLEAVSVAGLRISSPIISLNKTRQIM